ncbi:hypothetical protein HYFRA_00008795 [Hymenoscyphus fraxineus]|uniref:Uncharacterized protein n=1 Tax=Hymenoscyphus fraxineus TaxID=746836 RepID=A0A9N9PVU4_9HELO|nr:hypothetical protein HYFRA_00008795 [Hymenoscyphus fraxineus]
MSIYLALPSFFGGTPNSDPGAIANNFHDIIYAEVHKVTFQEGVSYLHGHEEYAVTRLLCGVWNTREILHGRLTELFHREKNKFLEVEEELCSRHPLAHWILASSLQLSSAQPQDALAYLFRSIIALFANEDPAYIVNRFAVLEIRFALMAEKEGNWSELSTDFSFLEEITYGDPKVLTELITDTESELFHEFSVKAFIKHPVLDGIRRLNTPAIELSEILKLSRLIDPHNNYVFYRKHKYSTMDPISGLTDFFHFVPYFEWRQQRGRLVEGESDLSQVAREGFGIKEV